MNLLSENPNRNSPLSDALWTDSDLSNLIDRTSKGKKEHIWHEKWSFVVMLRKNH